MKVQYSHTLVRGEALHQFESLSADAESTKPLAVEAIILGLGSYFSRVNLLLKKNCAMHRGMKNPHRLKNNTLLSSFY